MKKLICPKCRNLLQSIIYSGIEVDRCQNCAGIWFDALEAEALKHIHGSESLDQGNPHIGSYYDRISGKMKCPRCQANLRRMLDIDRYSIWYERCARCSGIWLDAGEFSKFKQNFRSQSLRSRSTLPPSYQHLKGSRPQRVIPDGENQNKGKENH
ncbi:MAG: zf-TFIIB domain-containing protein [Jaaginema sp. PMC 1079.18]|nr:zf-TFIIB domain-containing protein [Jaaginema sp. PMC 1080.18]MEC4850155.1 zf-TFIIB domain-containing protein [Jaaginema sp. PMC 1079.18]MEC4866062.1 zf-TFIIB domain-containing protein [Jaaginema sp. PMC 1078.18]